MKRILALLCAAFLVLTMATGVFADEGNGNPIVPTFETSYGVSIDSPTVSSQYINAGDTFNISFYLNGNSKTTWVYPDGSRLPSSYSSWDNTAKTTASVSGNGFTLAGALAEQELVNGRNTVSILSDSSLKSGRYQVTLTVTCTGADGKSVSDARTFNIDIESSEVELEENSDTPKFTLTGASIPEGKGKSNLSTKLSISLTNETNYPANDVSVTLTGLGDLILNTYTDTVNIGSVAAGDEIKATFPVKFPEYPQLQTTLTAKVDYKDAQGNQHTDNVNIYLQAKVKEKEENKDDKTLTPKVIVSSYSVDVEKVISGEEFVLTFILKNTSHDKDIMNMTVNVNTMSSGSSGNGQSANETVFSPIDGVTSFYTEKLEKDGEVEYKIRLKTSASAGAKSYPIEIGYKFEYERNGVYNSGDASMPINIPVTQPIKFELMEWYPPEECPASGTSISFQYFNKSKNPMTNLAVSMEGDFTMPTQYVGTLNASSYDFFAGQITPNDPGAVGQKKNAILVFTFEDASSNEQRVEYPFEVTVTEAAAMNPGDPGMMMPGDVMDPGMMDPGMDPGMFDPGMDANGDSVDGNGLPGWAKYAIGGGILAVVIVIIVVIVVVSKKRKVALYDEDDE